MKFLESLYSNENFGIYLFGVIAFLVVLFFVVLFFGKKDESKSKKEEKSKEEDLIVNDEEVDSISEPVDIVPAIAEPQLETVEETESANNILDGFKEVPTELPLSIPQDSEPVKIEEEKPEYNFPNMVLNSNLIEEEPKEEVKQEDANDILKKEFDFDALADAISKELDTINRSREPEIKEEEKKLKVEEIKSEPIAPVIEEKTFEFPVFESVKPDKIPESVMPHENEEVVKPKEKPVMPTVFSSVYVNRDDEKKKEEIEPEVTKPKFELPKMADLPRKVEEKVEPKENFTINNVLEMGEEESYTIQK